MELKTQMQQRLLAFSQGNLRDDAQSVTSGTSIKCSIFVDLLSSYM